MRFILLTSGILVLLLLSGCGEHNRKQTSWKNEVRFQDYKVKISELDDGGSSRVEILKGKTPVYEMSGHRFYIGICCDGDETKTNATPIGMDITGGGQPNLIISEYTGGAHCCSLVHIFEIGTKFRHIQTLDLADSCADFKNLDSDPALELPMHDWAFAYWNACFAASPAPEVIFKYSGGQYQVASNLMRKLPRRQAELIETAAKIKLLPEWKDPAQKFPPALWREMLNLIYTGNMAQAWKLFDFAWPEGMAGKQEFLEEFKAQLKKSLYWEQIQNMNKKSLVKEP
jgi:hypothetical protein